MTEDELDAAVLAMTDSQIMALLARRTAARASLKREQTAARVRKYRGNAGGNAGETPHVTQKKGYIPSGGNADGNANVTPSVTQEPLVLVPPLHPPSAPTHPHEEPPPPVAGIPATPKPPKTRARTAAPTKPEDVEIPPVLAEQPDFSKYWLKFIDMRRLIRQPMTFHAAELALSRLTERPTDAVDLLKLAVERQWQGVRWFLLDQERQQSLPGFTNANNTHGSHQRPSPSSSSSRPAPGNRNTGTANAGDTSNYGGVGKIPVQDDGVPNGSGQATKGDADGGGAVPS